MKKQTDSKFVKLVSRILNVRAWADWDRMKSFTLYLGNGFKQLFVPQKNTPAESFDEATKNLDITDETLLIKQKALLRLSIIMLVVAACILGYAGYQMFYGTIKAVIVSLVVTMIALTLAFRYHFWYFQIKSRKLGCTFDEWFRHGLLGENK